MKRTELERAWPAADPPQGFSERVMERLQLGAVLSEPVLPAEPVPARAGALSWWRGQRVRWLVLPAAALALGGALLLGGRGLLWPAGPAREGDVIAAEPRIVSIGERVVAELSSGAHVHWSGEGEEVQQDRGAVTYRVQPGGSFRVQTPHGSVTALGTVFHVVVADDEEARGELMKKRWAIAGASATFGALLWVSVDRGSVRISNGREEIVLAAGQAGAIGSEGLGLASAPVDAGGGAAKNAERARLRQVADGVRRHAAQQRAVTLAAKQTAAKRPASGQEPSEQTTTPPVEFVFRGSKNERRAPETAEGIERREYLNRAIHEQYFPVARDCYQELLERKPTAAGKVVLEFAIVGDGDAGVVDRVELREDKDTIEDPEFLLCMTESMYAAVFQPPPPGAEETTVVYPIMLSPE
ncbi:MAG: hypothetical protein RL685_7095 [Pseudomonadota bacterium]|jgi:ferric-dicitrate binding protein FerR (iron transport regulator)